MLETQVQTGVDSNGTLANGSSGGTHPSTIPFLMGLNPSFVSVRKRHYDLNPHVPLADPGRKGHIDLAGGVGTRQRRQ